MKRILDTPSLKDGSGRELRRLHDVVLQQLRALKGIDYDPSEPFITSLLELKLESVTMFEWQKHTQSLNEILHYHKLLDFNELRAQASGASAGPGNKFGDGSKKLSSNQKVVSFAGTADTIPTCIVCKSGKHPVYMCAKFKAFSHEKMLFNLKTNGPCINCLKSGHFVGECKSSHCCRKCKRLHHTLLHLEPKEGSQSARD